MNAWFRLYSELLDDPKVQTLPPQTFKDWINCLCLASKNNGTLPPISDIAFGLRISDQQAEGIIRNLSAAGLIDKKGRFFHPHNWDNRQYKSDNSSDRVERYRDKRRSSGLPILSDYNKFRPALIARDGERCVYCESGAKLVVDHMQPIALKGTDHEDNLALACKPCNSGKAGRTPEMAGMVIRVTSAAQAFQRYCHANVTVSVTDQNRTDTEQIQNPPIVPLTGDEVYSPDFELFWTSYPRHTGKGAAFKSWKKLKPSETLQAKIQTAIENQRGLDDWSRENGRFIPHASTWLNQRRFDDDSKPKPQGRLMPDQPRPVY